MNVELQDGINAFKRRGSRMLPSYFSVPWEDATMLWLSSDQECHLSNLTKDMRLPKNLYCENYFCCLSHLFFGMLFWVLGLTRTLPSFHGCLLAVRFLTHVNSVPGWRFLPFAKHSNFFFASFYFQIFTQLMIFPLSSYSAKNAIQLYVLVSVVHYKW